MLLQKVQQKDSLINLDGMTKLRKGSIAWDVLGKRKCKVLTKPGDGEMPDRLVLATGKRYDKELFSKFVLVTTNGPSTMSHNNQFCDIMKIDYLIPYKRYLVTLN